MTIGKAILLPGLDGTGDLFAPFVSVAPQGIETVVVSYPVGETAIDALKEFARAKLENNCIVIAESFSGPIGVSVASDPRVRALILCNSFIRSPFAPSIRHLAVAPFFAIPLPKFMLRAFLLGSHVSPSLLESTHRAITCLPASVIARRVREVSLTDERATVRALGKPILYLRGLGDNLISENSWRVLKENQPDARIAEIDGPHMLLQTSPKECWAAILRFVELTAAG